MSVSCTKVLDCGHLCLGMILRGTERERGREREGEREGERGRKRERFSQGWL